MAYFSNGSEGMAYEAKWCDRCAHQQGCHVWLAQMLYNYKQCDDTSEGKRTKEMLDLFIPRTEDGLDNKGCTMFHAATAAEMKEEIASDPLNKPAPWIQEWQKAQIARA